MKRWNRMMGFALVAVCVGLSACGQSNPAPDSTAPTPTIITTEITTEATEEPITNEETMTKEEPFPYEPGYNVTYERLNTGYVLAISTDGQYAIHALADGHDGSPVYVYNTQSQEVNMIQIPVGISYPYIFGHDNLIIALGITGLIMCDPQTGEVGDNFIDFDNNKQTIIGMCYDIEQELYIAAWREYGIHDVRNLGPIPEDEDPAIVQRMSEGYYPVQVKVFAKDGTCLRNIQTEYRIIGGLQNFIITVDMEAIGDSVVRITEHYMRDAGNRKVSSAEIRYGAE